MRNLPNPSAQKAPLPEIILSLPSAVRLENISLATEYGIAVGVGGPGPGPYVVEFEFEGRSGIYEIWIEYAALESRPQSLLVNGVFVGQVTANETGGWMEDSQLFCREVTVELLSGRQSLALVSAGYPPHVRTVALLPVVPTASETVFALPTMLYAPRSPERTLVCILAQTRCHGLTWSDFKINVLDELDADLAVCIGVPPDYDYGNPFWQHAKYKWVAPEFHDFGEAFDDAQGYLLNPRAEKIPYWRTLLQIKDQWLGGVLGEGQHRGSAAILIYFRWLLLKKLRQDGIDKIYDRIIVTRSDYMWKIPHPPISILDSGNIWIPDGEQYGGLTDRHTIISSNDLDTVLNLLYYVVAKPTVMFEKMVDRDNWNLERVIRWHFEQTNAIDRVRHFPYVMYSVRQESDTTRWSIGEYNPDLGYYIKYPSEYASFSAFKDRIKVRADWLKLYKEAPLLFRKALE